jgi:Uma2 family endonuclease
MRVVMLDAPEDLIAERHRLGHDRRDEVWEGEYHMVPPPNIDHQLLESDLIRILGPEADVAGLKVVPECGVYDPAAGAQAGFRVPDLTVFAPEHATERGVEGQAELVIEIRSPGDESYEKMPFYERVGVGEVLVIERNTKALRHWVRIDDHLVEIDASTGAVLQVLDVRLHVDGAVLVVETAAGTHRI